MLRLCHHELAPSAKTLDLTLQPNLMTILIALCQYKFRPLKHFLSRGHLKPSNGRVQTDERQISKRSRSAKEYGNDFLMTKEVHDTI